MGNCDDEYRDLDAHDACKIYSKQNLSEFEITEGPESLIKHHDKVITNLVPDCPSPCSNEDYVPFLNNPLNVRA